jgi:hypothetical protein
MQTRTKLSLSRLTFGLMIFTIVVIAVWFIGFLLTITFDLTVFDQTASNVLAGLLAGAFVLVACSAILNVSLNISIIADSRLKKIKDKGTPLSAKLIVTLILALLVLTGAFLFAGDYYSRQRTSSRLRREGRDVMQRYSKSIDHLAQLVDWTAYNEIPKTLKFLSSLKREFPSVQMIIASRYNKQIVYLTITPHSSPKRLTQPYFGYNFYKCGRHDCAYLKKVFSDNHDKNYLWNKDNNYRLYIPVQREGKNRFVLLFNKQKRYGSIGSTKFRGK